MLKNFYRIIDSSPLQRKLPENRQLAGPSLFTIELDPSHPVYNGHFPGNPVVPGVCQLQIIKELVCRVTEQDLRLYKSDNIKFLSMIVPSQTPLLTVNIDIRQKDQSLWDVSAIISHNEMVFIKFRGGFRLSA